ncbi:unnamed protein product [Brassicogethes aeneus]|uniref:PH domain-containing protein n=1 Tax=Brassicogethes aeneus TaxID=1431903 RepID=A0A9P0BI17_BRAAE|nr:unnamed protein product [Brassicogethes aeneus]
MLIATPYRDFDVRDKSPPKIISEIRKNYSSCNFPSIKTKISGDVLLKCSNDRHWSPRRVNIRGGQLHVSPLGHGVVSAPGCAIKLPLRHLSLQAGPLTNSLSLCRGQNIVLTLQAANGSDFDKWVKTIAIELIRQTPLDAIKYLDILSIAQCLKKDKSLEKDWNFNYINTPPPSSTPPTSNQTAHRDPKSRGPSEKMPKCRKLCTCQRETFPF